MKVVSIVSTKGGVGKTTTAANIGAFLADAGLRVLLVDLDVQPTLSSYFELPHKASGGIYELLARNEQRTEKVVSHTLIANLDVIVSNDDRGQLNTLLLHAADGRLRLRNLLRVFAADYDLMLIDTQGARSVLLETAVLASEMAVSPVMPEILAARELQRGTVQLIHDLAPFRALGIEPPRLRLLVNRAHPVSASARIIQDALRQIFAHDEAVEVLRATIPANEAFSRASIMGLPVHRIERRKPKQRHTPAAFETLRDLVCELFPEWAISVSQFSGIARDVERSNA